MSMKYAKVGAPSKSIGEPAYRKPVNFNDVFILTTLMLCSAAALITVRVTAVAIYLGQTYQLVLLGFLLGIMALCSQRQCLRFFLVIQARYGDSTLQNFEAILRFDAFSTDITRPVKFALLSLFALPLGISAAYKLFTGGVVTRDADSVGGLFGLSGPPGTQRLGNGLSLMVNATLPFIVKPSISKAYGSNMYVVSNDTTAMLDGPVPAYVSELRSGLTDSQSIEVSALVNATVGSARNPTDKARRNQSFGVEANSIPLYPGTFAFLTDPNNHSMIYVSTSGRTGNDSETFGSQAVGVFLERRRCNGTWRITRSSIDLQHASCQNQPYGNQGVLTKNYMALEQYIPQLAEFLTQPYNHSQQNPAHIEIAIPVVTAMIWSRVVSLNGPEIANASWILPEGRFPSPLFGHKALEYYAPLVEPKMNAIALRQSGWLYLVIMVNPIITLIVTAWKARLYTTAVGEGFGLIAILAGIPSRSTRLFQGASLSGKLESPVKIRMAVVNSLGLNGEDSSSESRIQYSFGDE